MSSFYFNFTYVIDLSFLVSKSAHWLFNSRRHRFSRHLNVGHGSEKWPKNQTKILRFDQEFEKTTFKQLLLCHCLTFLNLKICTKVLLKGKSLMRGDFLIFGFCATYSPKTYKIDHFCYFWNFNALQIAKKQNFKNKLSLSFLLS